MTYADRTGTERTIYFGIRRSEDDLPLVELGDTVVYFQHSDGSSVQLEKAEAVRIAEICEEIVAGKVMFFGIGKYAEMRRHVTGHVDLMIRSVVPDLDDRII